MLTLLLVAVLISPSFCYHPEAYDYVLFTIEYLANVEPGVFSCVFYDLTPRHPFGDDSILGQLLRSPQLDHVLKLALNGSQPTDVQLGKLPDNPSLIVIDPGSNAFRLERSGILSSDDAVIGVFNPATKVLVLVDTSKPRVVGLLLEVLRRVWRFNKVAFIDCTRMTVILSNVATYSPLNQLVHPGHLFTLVQRRLAGRKITYYSDRDYIYSTDQDALWVTEVARYLNTDVEHYQHGCSPGRSFVQCMSKQETLLGGIDIKIDATEWTVGFRIVFTTSPTIGRILVPRDRPLNAAELLLLPFSWQVWLLLLVILTTAQAMKHIFPNHFQNDPILLVVCGFERHNLHETGRWEKMILHSLIILMFFASSAFETRIISLMISKPSVQRVKTVNDLETFGIKFYADLDRFPLLANHPTIGKYIINGHQNLWDTIPGMGIYVDEMTAKFAPIVVFDYKRKLPWYVPLDFRSLDAFQMFQTSYRNPLLEYFHRVRLLLAEGGIYGFWEDRNVRDIVDILTGRRLREDMASKIYLTMDDILPAWMILGIGAAIAAVVFLGEFIKKRVNLRDLLISLWRRMNQIWKYCNLQKKYFRILRTWISTNIAAKIVLKKVK